LEQGELNGRCRVDDWRGQALGHLTFLYGDRRAVETLSRLECPQPFALVVNADLDPAAGLVLMDKAVYGDADTITVQLTDGSFATIPTPRM